MLTEEINAIIAYLQKQAVYVDYGMISVAIDQCYGTNIDASLAELERLAVLDKRKIKRFKTEFLLKPVVKQELLFIPLEFVNNPYHYFLYKEANKSSLPLNEVEKLVEKPFTPAIKTKVTEIQ